MLFLLFLAMLPALTLMGRPPNAVAAGGYVYGVSQSNVDHDTSHLAQTYSAGVRLVSFNIAWDRYQPQDGVFDSKYAQQMKQAMQAYRAAGFQLILDPGIVYPPPWLFSYPNSQFVNQYGDSFLSWGNNGLNAVFNQTIRDKERAYLQRVFRDLGTDFYAVRLGGGTVNEVNYPPPAYNGHSDSYWAFDAIAQGRASGLPTGMGKNPVPGWRPGQPSAGHQSASAFINWYLDSLANYQNWQIATVRKLYAGKILVMYGGWGVRTSQIDAAIQGDLSGTTEAERNGDLEKGTDYARLIKEITDANAIPYTTWLEAPYGDDSITDSTYWRPVHYIAYHASLHPLRLSVWGESAGNNSHADMQLAFSQLQKYGLRVLIWTFEDQLYDGQHATINNYATLIAQY